MRFNENWARIEVGVEVGETKRRWKRCEVLFSVLDVSVKI
jgi:hypothetical protein